MNNCCFAFTRAMVHSLRKKVYVTMPPAKCFQCSITGDFNLRRGFCPDKHSGCILLPHQGFALLIQQHALSPKQPQRAPHKHKQEECMKQDNAVASLVVVALSDASNNANGAGGTAWTISLLLHVRIIANNITRPRKG